MNGRHCYHLILPIDDAFNREDFDPFILTLDDTPLDNVSVFNGVLWKWLLEGRRSLDVAAIAHAILEHIEIMVEEDMELERLLYDERCDAILRRVQGAAEYLHEVLKCLFKLAPRLIDVHGDPDPGVDIEVEKITETDLHLSLLVEAINGGGSNETTSPKETDLPLPSGGEPV